MSLDNSRPGLFPNVKNPSEVDPLCPSSGRASNTVPHPPASYRTMSSFVPRPFPPPSLAEVPVEYIINQLRNLAPHYWNKPATADCTIIVPVPHPRGKSMRAPESPPFPPETLPLGSSPRHDPSNLGRRTTEPNLRCSPRISLKLHMDYLSAQSSFLRGLFSGASPLDLIHTAPSPPTCNTASRPPRQSGPFHVPASRLPRLLPSSPNHPTVFLPVPDPTSFHLLVHWMYFGRTNYIEDCLTQGVVQWEGLARNVEYLGLATEIKVFLGRWYGAWLHPGRTRLPCPINLDDSDSDSTDYGKEEEIDDDDDDALSTLSEGQEDIVEEIQRGRTRTVRHVQSSPAEFNRHRSA